MLVAVATIATHFASCQNIHDHMKDAFDDISYYHEGKDVPYNGTYYSELVQCLHKFNESNLYLS